MRLEKSSQADQPGKQDQMDKIAWNFPEQQMLQVDSLLNLQLWIRHILWRQNNMMDTLPNVSSQFHLKKETEIITVSAPWHPLLLLINPVP